MEKPTRQVASLYSPFQLVVLLLIWKNQKFKYVNGWLAWISILNILVKRTVQPLLYITHR